VRIKIQTKIDGVVREFFVNPAKEDLVAIKFSQAELMMLAQWPDANCPMVTGPKGFMAANPKIVQAFMADWPVEYHNSHSLPQGGVVGPDGRLLDKKG
jgi:hypothetical protein